MADSGLADAHPRHAELARRIINAALALGWPVGQRVTELELAAQLGVSRTPVRAALRVLESLGVVVASSSRGYVLARAGDALQAVSIPSRGSADEVLRARIIRDRLDGLLDAEHSQADLARRYDVSAPTLQRVFQRMEQEGIVARSGWRWSFMPSLHTRQSQEASYAFRIMLEPASLLLPDFRLDAASLRQLRSDHDALLGDPGLAGRDPMRIFDLDARFHETLADYGRNPFVVNAIRQQNALRRLLEVGTYSDTARVHEWCGEHLGILDALVEGEQAKAAALLETHLLRAERATKQAR